MAVSKLYFATNVMPMISMHMRVWSYGEGYGSARHVIHAAQNSRAVLRVSSGWVKRTHVAIV